MIPCIDYDYTAYVDYMDLIVQCPRKALKLKESLTIVMLGLFQETEKHIFYFYHFWTMRWHS